MSSRISIDQQYAMIGINITPAQLSINTPRPQMTIEQEKPEMTIDKESPKFKVNWKRVHGESGLQSAHDFTLSLRDNATNKMMQYVGESIQDGNLYADTTLRGNRIAMAEKRRNSKTSQVSLEYGNMPKSLPEIEWNPGYMHIRWSEHSFAIEWTKDYMPSVVVDPKYAVEIFLREKPYIKVTVDEDTLMPNQPGYQVDTSI